MTTLVLVRHGQASFGTHNYDKLSDTGLRQSEVLGRHWTQTRPAFDEAHSGDMERQRDTARHALNAAGMNVASSTNPAFNEYDADGLIRAYLPLVASENPDISLDKRQLFSDRRAFQRFYEKVIGCWLDDRPHDQSGIERWPEFCARCLDGLREISEPGGKSTKLVVTSGGVITAALHAALDLDDAAAFRLNWRIYNASQHVFRWGRSGLTLLGYNDVSHLELASEPTLLTYR